MTRRQTYQQGYVSKPIPTRSGTVFKIRYRVKSADGKWHQKAETLYGLSGKKAARAVLEERIRGASFAKPECSDLSLKAFVDAWWKPYLQRKGVKPPRKGITIRSWSCISCLFSANFALMKSSHCTSRDSSKQELRAGFQERLSAICFWSYRGSCRLHWTMT